MRTGTIRDGRGGRAWTLGLAVLALTVSAPASQITWDGGGADANWTTGNNWDTNVVPAAANDVTFGSAFTSGTGISLAGADRTVNSLTIDTAAGLVIGPGESARTLTLNNSNLTRTAASKGEQSVQPTLYLGGSSGTWDIQGSGRLVLRSLLT